MTKDWALSQELFDSLLNWLDPDRDKAGTVYEDIRRRLIKVFAARGCAEPEHLADETMNRVARKLVDIKETFSGDPARYFYGVATRVHLEYLRSEKRQAVQLPSANSTEIEDEYHCLELCLQQLSAENRELVLAYYQNDKRKKIEQRKELAERLGILPNSLRLKAFRIRASLYHCVQECLARSAN